MGSSCCTPQFQLEKSWKPEDYSIAQDRWMAYRVHKVQDTVNPATYMNSPCVEKPSYLLLGLLGQHGLLPPHRLPQAPNSQQPHMPPTKPNPPASTPGLGPGSTSGCAAGTAPLRSPAGHHLAAIHGMTAHQATQPHWTGFCM